MVTLYEFGAENSGTNEVAKWSPHDKSDTMVMISQTKKHRPYIAGSMTPAMPVVE